MRYIKYSMSDQERSQPQEVGQIDGDYRKRLISRYLPLSLLAVIILIIGTVSPNFITAHNILNVIQQSSTLGIMAIGLAVVLICGGMDLSIPAMMALSGILGAMFMKEGGNPIVGGLIMVLVGAILGSVNGFAVAYLGMIPFVVTLSMMFIATGLSIWVTNAVSITGLHPAFTTTITAVILLIPLPIIVLVVATVLISFFMRRSVFGQWIYAVGTNRKTARVSGIPTTRVIFATYIFSGFMAGLAAILTTARLQAAAATMGQEGVVLDVISSAVVGGVSIYGGVGSTLGAVLGAFIISLISNSMNLLQVEYYTTLTIKGLLIMIIVAIDTLRNR